MQLSFRIASVGAFLLLCTGCMSGPLIENPMRTDPPPFAEAPNPVYVPGGGGGGYALVFESALDVVDDYFEITESNRYSGRIVTFPRTAPGLFQPWRPGSPDFYERLYATKQSVRNRAVVLIQAAENGGFFVDVRVFKELEDVPRPILSSGGAAAFRSDPTVDRQYEVVDPTVVASEWIPIGRDIAMEQEILCRISELSAACAPVPKRTTALESVSGFLFGKDQ